jgi:dienelactone hydrolase
MSSYDPFVRGPHPVGVRTFTWTDQTRQRTLPVEVWYPARNDYAGQDLNPDTQDHFQPISLSPPVSQEAVRDAAPAEGESRPLLIFSHGFGGTGRQTTHLCTHWASHGYVVAAMDHVGNTTEDVMAAASQPMEPSTMIERLHSFATDRPADVTFVIDRMLAGDADLPIDAERVGVSGHSFGGWTTLASVGTDERIRAALPLAPAGGQSRQWASSVAGRLADALSMSWEREVPTLFLVAELDGILPLDSMHDLIQRTPHPRRAVNLLNADHFHFCDRVEQTHDMVRMMGQMLFGTQPEAAQDAPSVLAAMKPSSELCPGEHAYALLQGLGLAHMDAHLRQLAPAHALLQGDLAYLMAERGVAVEVVA